MILSGISQAEEDGRHTIPLTRKIDNVQTKTLFKVIENEFARAVTRGTGWEGEKWRKVVKTETPPSSKCTVRTTALCSHADRASTALRSAGTLVRM